LLTGFKDRAKALAQARLSAAVRLLGKTWGPTSVTLRYLIAPVPAAPIIASRPRGAVFNSSKRIIGVQHLIEVEVTPLRRSIRHPLDLLVA
jgi:hypothetical protein